MTLRRAVVGLQWGRRAGEARGPHRAIVILLPLGILLLMWVWLIYATGAVTGGPNGIGFGSDFAMFYAASHVQQDGGNPYDHQSLYRSERTLLGRERIAITTDRPLVRVGNPPLFFWLLRPLRTLPFRTAALWWLAAMTLALLAGLLLVMQHLNWSAVLLPLLMAIATPQATLALFYGNITAFLFAALMSSLVLAARFPFLAGVIGTVAWLRPQLGLPFVLLIALFNAVSLRRYAAGLLSTSLVLAVLTLLTLGWGSQVAWVHGLGGYGSDLAVQPNLASLTGIYARVVSLGLRTVLEVMQIVAASTFTAVLYRRKRTGHQPVSPVSLAMLWLTWFLAVPYAHFPDEIFLTYPLLLVLGRNGEGLLQSGVWISLYGLFFSILLFTWSPGGVQLLWLPLIGIAALWSQKRVDVPRAMLANTA